MRRTQAKIWVNGRWHPVRRSFASDIIATLILIVLIAWTACSFVNAIAQ